MQKIEISDKVWQYLQRLAIPFVDQTPDDVLRRILPKVTEAKGVVAGTKLAVGADDGEVGPSRKERGDRARQDYISRLQKEGLTMRLAGGIWAYLERGDSWVALPSATERRPNRWFLGISEREATEKGRAFIALLCQEESGSVVDIVLPPDVVTMILPRLFCYKGQVKFNVKRVGNRYQLMIPRAEPMDLSSYVKGRSLLSK